MEALYSQPLEEDGVTVEGREESGEQEKEGNEALCQGSTTDEETDEDSEPEPLPVVRRKVSFADAFGLNLVSVKEFHDVDVESGVTKPAEMEATHPLEEFYMSCLFTVPSSPEELDQRLQVQMVELESIELLPGTTTLRGIIRVVNLCYSKSVYARITLDCWNSYFDLLAEYVPGSSDMKTDRFAFKYTLIPPFERKEIRVDFCLRYETSVGTFWANNKDINYVLFCHQRGQVKERGPQVPEDSPSYWSKRSCLRANRRGSAEEITKETINTATFAANIKSSHKAEEAERNTVDNADLQSLLYHEEQNSLVDSVKSQRRGIRLARVKDHLSRRRQQVPKAYSHDSGSGQNVSQSVPALWSDSATCLYNCQKNQPEESPQVHTDHQTPLLTLDLNNDKPQLWEGADRDDIRTGSSQLTLSKEDLPSVNDMWETFRNGTDDTTDKETSVCDVWQEFLNGLSSKDHSDVPESEWLQTAASVSPSNDKEPQIQQYAASRQEFQEFQVGPDTSTALQADTSAVCQPLSDKRKTPSANVALNTEANQLAEACVSSPRDDNTATQAASQRSQTDSVTDIWQKSSHKGATPVSEGSVDSSAECDKYAIWEREREAIIGGADGLGGDEPFTPHTADFITSSGESKTTETTVMPESQNASTADTISQGARLDEGLSSRGEGEVTGTTHNALVDTLAFRETIRQGTKDKVGFVFSTSRHRAEEGIMKNCTENEKTGQEVVFRPHKTEESQLSQRYADEKQFEEFRLSQKSKNPLQKKKKDENEIRTAVQSHGQEFNPSQTCKGDFRPSLVKESEINLDELENKDMAPNSKEGSRQKEMIHESNEAAWQRNDDSLQLNSSVWQTGNTSTVAETHNKWGEGVYFQEEENSTLTHAEKNTQKSETGEHEMVSSSSEITVEEQEINPPSDNTHTVESGDRLNVFQNNHDTLRPFPTDKCNPSPTEEVEMRWTSSQDVMKGQMEDVGSKTIPGQVMVKENIAKKTNSTEHQYQPEITERIEEDISQRKTDDRVSFGELETGATVGLTGNVEDPQGDREKAPAEVKEQEMYAEGESVPCVESKKLSEGTKEPITAASTVAPEVTASSPNEMFIRRFGEDLVSGIWEEVFSLRVPAPERDTNITEGEGTDIRCDCQLHSERDVSDAFDSGIFSLTELQIDPELSPSHHREEAIVTNSNEHSTKERRQSLLKIEQTPLLSELQADLNLSAHLSQDLTASLAPLNRPSLTESAQALSSLKDPENYSQIKNRLATHQETDRQIEGCLVGQKENFNRLSPHSPEHPSSEKIKESDGLVWWSLLYMLSHITRLIICTFLVAGFFVIIFLYDFPAFFALYIFSLSWWFYKWRSHRVGMNKGIAHELARRRESVKECSI